MVDQSMAVADYRIRSASQTLRGISLRRIENRTFTDQDVYLDGRHFVGCTFIRCRLITELGHFELGGRIEMEGSRLALFGPAAAAVNVNDLMAGKSVPGVGNQVRDPD